MCHLMCFKRSAGQAMRCKTHVQAWRMYVGRLGYSGFTAVNTNLLLLHICSPIFGLPFPTVWHVKDTCCVHGCHVIVVSSYDNYCAALERKLLCVNKLQIFFVLSQ